MIGGGSQQLQQQPIRSDDWVALQSNVNYTAASMALPVVTPASTSIATSSVTTTTPWAERVLEVLETAAVWMVSTLKRRNRKMNKHKLRKRRKKNRKKNRKM
jgi:Mitochondrial domain of unknown function (DUF1713)